MKKSILVGYQAIIVVVMVILAGYFISQGQAVFAAIYVLLALAGIATIRSEKKDHRAGTAGQS